jgi:nucleoside-diphosphate-sugar epimerase
MKILISGGCGFVGRAFSKRLLGDGHDVTVVDNLSSGIHPNEWDV